MTAAAAAARVEAGDTVVSLPVHHFWLTPNHPSFHGLLRGFTRECKNCVPCFKVTHLSQCRIHIRSSGLSWKRLFFLPLRFQILLMTASEITLASSSAVCGCLTLQAVTSCDAGRGVSGSHLRVVTITAVCVCTLVRLSAVFHLMALLLDSLFALPVH